MMQYYLGIDPTTLDDNEWAQKFKQLQDIREKEADQFKTK
jgi:hypothetical protein